MALFQRHVRRPLLLVVLVQKLQELAGLTVQDLGAPGPGPRPRDCEAPANAVVRENCLPGSPSEEWDINGAGSSSIQGFATRMSVAPGERLDFKVKTDSHAYRFDIYRLGYYAGLGARHLETLRPSARLPQQQPDCLLEQEALFVDCGNWEVSGSWTVPTGSVSGIYLARLVREDPPPHWRMDASEISPSFKFANLRWDYSKMPPCGNPPEANCTGMEHSYGAQRLAKSAKAAMDTALREPHASHIYFVVRDDSGRRADVLFQTIDTTWHAYNPYGGPNTYAVLPLPRHNFTLPPGSGTRRAYKRSYNVPVITRDLRAVNSVFQAEYPALRWLEANGYDVAYWSGVDAHARGAEILARGRVYLSVGHDEYWSGEQRRFVEGARDQGVHLCFFSGNEVYWKIRWEASLLGEPMRTMVVYKESQESFKIDPVKELWTGTFRDSRDINPEGPNPENALTGTIFTANAWRNDPLVVPWHYAALRFWRHTEVAGLKPRQQAVLLKGLIGHEFDEDLDNGARPAGLIRLSETRIHNVQVIVDAGGCFDSGTATHRLVMYKAGSGAIVFGAGTVQWAWGLDSTHDSPGGMPNYIENEYDTRVGEDLAGPEPAVQQATVNLLADMGVQPATLAPGLVPAQASTDGDAPSVVGMEVAALKPEEEPGAHAALARVSARAEDLGGGVVAAMEVSVREGRWHPMAFVEGTWQAEVDRGPSGGPVWVRAVDDSLNIGRAAELAEFAKEGRLGAAAAGEL